MNTYLRIGLVFLAILLVNVGFAQSISGKVVDGNNEPLSGVSVVTFSEGVKVGDATNIKGNFNINLAKNGNYTVQLSFIGFKDKQKKVLVKGNTRLGTIVLHESAEQLQEVEVIGRKRKDYNSDYSLSATKIAMKNIELPQSVGTVTKELIKDRQAYQITEAVKGVSSVTPVSFYNHFSIRGIAQNQDGQILNGMRTNQYYFLQPITQNIERIEVVKGPGSVTVSSADPGGSINMVTKKPLREARKELTFGVGSFSTLRGGLDFTGPLNKDKTMLYRLNVGVQQAKSFRDLVKNNAFLISPSFSYVPNDKTAVNVEVIYTDNTGNLDRGQPVFGKKELKTKADLLTTPITTNISAANDYANYKELILTTSLSQKITDDLRFNAQYMKQTWNEDLVEHRANGFIQDVNGNTVENLIRLRYAERQQFWETDNVSAYFTYDLKFGNNKSTFVAGYDLNRIDKPTGNGQNGARGYYDGKTIDYNGITIKSPKAGFYDLANPTNIIRNTQLYPMGAYAIPTQKLTTHGAYLQNVTKFNRLSVLLSLRHEWFKDDYLYDTKNAKVYKNEALIPRVGISYEVSKNINIYGTYLEGFQPHANTTSVMPVTANNFFWSGDSPSVFKPMTNNLIEFGAKAKLFKGKLNASMSVFQIRQKNILVKVADNGDLSDYVQRGKDRSRGVEFDFSGYITRELQINASYSYVDAIIEEDSNPDLVGARKEASPKNSANLWLKYDFSKIKALEGFSLGAGVQYSGDKLGWYDRTIKLPSYTIADLVLYYQPKKLDLEFSLKVNNVFDETYWTGALFKERLFPGTPRNLMFTTTYKF